MARGSGFRDISEVERVSSKVLYTLSQSKYHIQAQQNHYEPLDIDDFWTLIGNKKNKQWLIYACEVVTYVWGKRDLAAAKRLKARLKQLEISYARIFLQAGLDILLEKITFITMRFQIFTFIW